MSVIVMSREAGPKKDTCTPPPVVALRHQYLSGAVAQPAFLEPGGSSWPALRTREVGLLEGRLNDSTNWTACNVPTGIPKFVSPCCNDNQASDRGLLALVHLSNCVRGGHPCQTCRETKGVRQRSFVWSSTVGWLLDNPC